MGPSHICVISRYSLIVAASAVVIDLQALNEFLVVRSRCALSVANAFDSMLQE